MLRVSQSATPINRPCSLAHPHVPSAVQPASSRQEGATSPRLGLWVSEGGMQPASERTQGVDRQLVTHAGVRVNIWIGEDDEGRFAIPAIEQRLMKEREDFAAFLTRALYKVGPTGMVASNMAITSFEGLEEGGFILRNPAGPCHGEAGSG